MVKLSSHIELGLKRWENLRRWRKGCPPQSNSAQLTALSLCRVTGAQTVTVLHQHVTAADSGQAIVGDVLRGAGRAVTAKSETTP